jgi:hypothetical protein
VSTVNLGCKLDLKTIALKARNAEYNPKVRLTSSVWWHTSPTALTEKGGTATHLPASISRHQTGTPAPAPRPVQQPKAGGSSFAVGR